MIRPTAGLLLIAALASPALAADEPKGDLAKLQGSWTAKAGPNRDIPIALTIKGNAVEIKGTGPNGNEFKLKGEVKLDETSSPRKLDWVKFTGPQGNDFPDNLGLYKFEGDNLVICSGGPDNDRPTEFKAGEGGPPMLTTWTRVKDKEKDKVVEADEPKGDLAKLQGTWTGKVGPEGNIPVTMTLKGNAAVVKGNSPDGDEFTIKGELKVDDKAKPKTIDWVKFTLPDGNDLPDSLGIYKLEGDTLTVCSGGPGGDRPTEFKAGDQGPPMLSTWTRVKDKEKDKDKDKPAETEKPKVAAVKK